MDPLSTASAVAGLISLTINLFDGCVKGFILLSAAQGLGSRAAILNCQLEWEHYNLYSWASTVGLFKQPPELDASNPQLIEKTLRCLEQLLTDIQKLRENYRLNITVTAEELSSSDVGGSYFGTHNFRGQPFMKDIARVYQKRASPWRKLKWAAFDQDTFSHLVRDIHFFNEQLRNSLHQQDRTQCLSNTIEALEALVSTTTDRVILDTVIDKLQFSDTSTRASASLRKQKLLLDTHGDEGFKFTRTPPKQSHASECDLSLLEELSPGTEVSHSSLCKAVYSGSDVFVEWKDVPTTRDRYIKHRVASVANLLATVKHESFHSLRCVGYVKDSKNQRYGYMFRPPLSDVNHARSLANLMASGQWKPSLTTRVGIAKDLAEAVRQLHNAGWLHKSIQAENIQFFRSSWLGNLSACTLSNTYICGYSFAKIDTPTEMTEEPTVEQLLYRHPLATDADRIPFCKAFDLYSLGCVLLEIGLCKPLASILIANDRLKQQPNMQQLNNHTTLPQDILNTIPSESSKVFSRRFALIDDIHKDDSHLAGDLKFAVGDCYLEVVRTCIQLGSSVGDEHHNKFVFEAEIRIWKQLEELHLSLQSQGSEVLGPNHSQASLRDLNIEAELS